jgi:hypothetical protein
MREYFRRAMIALPLALAPAAIGCSDADNGIPQGAAAYRTFFPPAPPTEYIGRPCNVAIGGVGAETPLYDGAGVGVPELPPAQGYPKDKGGVVQDGQPKDGYAPYEVGCSVVGAGTGPYRISAKVKAGKNDHPAAQATSGGTHVEITGGVINENGTGYGKVTFYTTETFLAYPYDGVTCILEAVESYQKETPERQIGPGWAWLTFKCPGVKTGGQDDTYCDAEGTVFLQNCAKK